MKKILFMALGIISLMVACSPTRGLVRNPKIANTNSPEITITSIEFGNTETIVEMSFTLPAESGYWVRFNESTFLLTDRGGKYQNREVEGLKLGEKYYIPKSGKADFLVHFPPIEDKVQTVSFIEMDVDNGWEVQGIQIDKLEKAR